MRNSMQIIRRKKNLLLNCFHFFIRTRNRFSAPMHDHSVFFFMELMPHEFFGLVLILLTFIPLCPIPQTVHATTANITFCFFFLLHFFIELFFNVHVQSKNFSAVSLDFLFLVFVH